VRASLQLFFAVLLVLAPARAGASTFALVLGVNRGVDRDQVLLRFADDDAARFRDLFRAAGATTYVLARLDDNTRRLHPEVAAEAAPPTLLALGETVSRLAAAVAAERAAGRKTVLYLAYAGHGTAQGEAATLSLEDAQLSGADLLARIIDPVGADRTHVIVDACQSYFLVLDRGPGGARRPLQGYALGALARRSDVGLLLSTSSARESHEWAAFQAGVFSHEVRSGLYGAADADGDGVISYREIASFVERASAAVPNERYRPDVFARPPAGETTLLDLRAALANRIEIDAPRGHQFIEDTAGVRWVDFNGARSVRLIRPGRGRLYLRRPQDDREYVLPEGAPVLRTSQLQLVDARVVSRGAANDAFLALFALPFGADSVAAYGSAVTTVDAAPEPARPAWRRPVAAGLTVAGAAAVIAGGALFMSARTLHDEIGPEASQRTVDDTNRTVAARQRTGALLLGAGAAAVAGGVLLMLWRDAPAAVSVSPGEATVALRGRF
jgi:hypothetical protein